MEIGVLVLVAIGVGVCALGGLATRTRNREHQPAERYQGESQIE